MIRHLHPSTGIRQIRLQVNFSVIVLVLVVRLYLSSYKFGRYPERMLPLIKGTKKTAVIMNAQDNVLPRRRAERLQEEIEKLTNLGLQPEELDLRTFFGKATELKAYVEQYDYFWV